MDNSVLSPLFGYAPFAKCAEEAAKNGKIALYDLSESARAFVVSALAERTGRQILYVLPSDSLAVRAADDVGQLLPGRAAALPAPETQFVRAAASRESEWRRIESLYRARRGEVSVLCVPADALIFRYMPRKRCEEDTLCLKEGGELSPGDLIRHLVKIGYERVDMVEGKGQCALRGAIADIYPPCFENAVRVEFFGDEIDSIRTFDAVSQRSVSRLSSCELPPACEWLLPEAEAARGAEKMRGEIRAHIKAHPQSAYMTSLPPVPEEEIEQEVEAAFTPRGMKEGLERFLEDADTLEQEGAFRGIGLWTGLIAEEWAFLWDWLTDPMIVLDSPDRLNGRCDDRRAGFEEDFKLALTRQEAVPAQSSLLMDFADVAEEILRGAVVTLQDFLRGMSGFSPETILRFPALSASRYQSRMREMAADLKSWRGEDYTVLLLAGGVARAKRLTDALNELSVGARYSDDLSAGEPGKEARVLPLSLSGGFIMQEAKFAVISDADLYGQSRRKARKTQTAGERIEAFTDLKAGDYVVHEHHGVGVFQGVVRLQSEGTYRDYLYIQYMGNDKLYVPTDQFDRVRKFIGSQDTPPSLNRLGGGEWEKQKAKVKQGLQKLAFDLVRLYAARQATPGFSFPRDGAFETQFEDNFPFELTPDQRRAIRDVSRDMESTRNMDRLICGDVGYGKTEVAMRAAFKAVSGGKQAAILAPTTILAQQHYYTLLKRFDGFPVRVAVLSRFRSPKEQKETLKALSEGKIDILVGTHRLLGKDVKFKDLGLLVVDEEQRFGVGHKEQIKNIKKTVDVLTLSATPIPRTLHMSMVGVRDMSLLETPPEERFPVQTYVMDYSDAVIRDAILREIARGGQVFFLYNRVRSIDDFYARLKALVPEARIGVGHGQMKEHALEDAMMDFYNGEYDVLLCTTIIENGLDVPRANTLIVFDADRFGLSQLYQLRGRVGRSSRVAYAYFTVRPDKMLSEDAQKRLAAIREFTEFGSGFRIAMRDLEIRGAGNIFGPEQSGHVSLVGYDMYCKLVEEAVREARGEGEAVKRDNIETRVDLALDAFLPPEYVRGEAQRMEIYKRISLIRSQADREDALEELIDRFGEPPREVMNLIDVAHLRALCGYLGITRVTRQKDALIMKFDPALLPDLFKLYEAMRETDARFSLSAGKSPAMLFSDKRPVEDMLRDAAFTMEKLCRKLNLIPEDESESD